SFAGLQYNPDGNYGITLNQGFDGTVDLSPIPLAKDLSISFRGTFTYNKDKLIENGAAPYEEPWMDPRGQNINSSQGYVAEGIFQSQAEIDNHADQSGVGGNARVGDLKYKDLNGDGIINVYDQTTINHGDVPRWIFGFGFNLNYKQFYISAFFQGNYGAQRAVSDIARAPFADGAYGNVLANTTDRWTEENHATNPFYPRLGYGTSATANNDVASSWWVKDISFIRFKTLDMGYNLPKGAFRQIGLKNARIYFSGVNLLYWSKFKLWDPEMNTGNGGAYPNTRTFSLGIQANF
ncbi:MAG: TonB-dependent receptor, partial [Pseudopedobacter saltans]